MNCAFLCEDIAKLRAEIETLKRELRALTERSGRSVSTSSSSETSTDSSSDTETPNRSSRFATAQVVSSSSSSCDDDDSLTSESFVLGDAEDPCRPKILTLQTADFTITYTV